MTDAFSYMCHNGILLLIFYIYIISQIVQGNSIPIFELLFSPILSQPMKLCTHCKLDLSTAIKENPSQTLTHLQYTSTSDSTTKQRPRSTYSDPFPYVPTYIHYN